MLDMATTTSAGGGPFYVKSTASGSHLLQIDGYSMLVQHLGCTSLFLTRTNELRETMEWRHRAFPAGARTPPWAHIHPTLIPLRLTLHTNITSGFIARLTLEARTPRCPSTMPLHPHAPAGAHDAAASNGSQQPQHLHATYAARCRLERGQTSVQTRPKHLNNNAALTCPPTDAAQT
jgi:hypothetical protein